MKEAKNKLNEESRVRQLYQELLNHWNNKNADGMANLFIEDGNVIGFDGSQMNGRSEIATQILDVFAHHQTASYVSIVREVCFLSIDVALLRAVTGMVPPGQKEINPAVNTIQSLVAVKKEDQWQVALFQNTPAAFHGRPELSQQLSEELRQVLKKP